jgi:hypothetical protein
MTQSRNGKRDTPVALAALRRSAKVAVELAVQTGTPCFAINDGGIVDIAARGASKKTGNRKIAKKK